MPKPYRHSPAALALAHAGIPQRAIQERLGYASVSAISDQLRGDQAPNPELISTIRLVAGPDVADAVAGILGIEVAV